MADVVQGATTYPAEFDVALDGNSPSRAEQDRVELDPMKFRQQTGSSGKT